MFFSQRTGRTGSGSQSFVFRKEPETSHDSKMADQEEQEFTTSKRARWSSESSCDQNTSFVDTIDQRESNEGSLLRLIESEQNYLVESQPSEIELREQHGVHVSSDRLESDDFPTCFSVEDDLDDIDEHHFQPIAGPMGWIQRQMTLGINPEDILAYMLPHTQLPPALDKGTLWKVIIDILTEPTPRQKLDHINFLDDVVELLRGSKNVIVLTGAGVSVSCGIPDFRSRDGIYAKLSVEYPDLPDPQAMFDIEYFYQNPRPFFKFAKEIYPGQFAPSLGHRFIKQLESNGQLLKNYSQNIDTLEQIAGIARVIQCHGSFSTASCTNCKHQVSCEVIREEIFQQVIPLCPKCPQDGSCFAIMKPDIVFFGESLPPEFYHNLEADSDKADLLIVIGSSLKVRPVALIPSHLPPEVPQILINREPLRHMTFDVELLGDCDVIITELCQRLDGAWNNLLEGVEIPDVETRPLSRNEENTTGEMYQGVNFEEIQRSEQTTAGGTNNEKSPSSNVKQRSEDVTPNTTDNHVTVGESSGYEETRDDSYRDQPRASASDHGKECSFDNSIPHEEGSPRFLFIPPSRYIFYGAEVMDSPLPSPSRHIPGYLDSTSEESDSDSVGEIDDSEASRVQLGDITGDQAGNDCSNLDGCKPSTNQVTANSSEGESNSDDGFGEGEADVEKVLEPIVNNEDTRQALSLILGGLSSYTCESEENSRVSSSDDPLTVGSSVASDSNCLLGASEALLANRPFSAVTMDTLVTMPSHMEDKNLDQTEDASPKKGEENVSVNVNREVSNEAWTEISSDFLQS